MTLVQVLADEKSLHMACDFRLSNPFTRQPTSNTAYKLITAQTVHGQALIGITGVALLDGRPIGEWVAEAVGSLGISKSVDDLLDTLRKAESAVARIDSSNDRRLTFVVGTFIGSQSLIGLVSNYNTFSNGHIRDASTPAKLMTISRIKPKAAVFFAAGDANSIRPSERDELSLALRSGVPDNKIQEKLRELNQLVSTRTTTVSRGCQASSLHATGFGSGQPFLTDQQPGDFIPPETADFFRRMGIRLNRQIGPDGKPMPIRMVQSASGTSSGTPEYFREQLKLRPESAELWNNYGAFLNSRRQRPEATAAFEKAHELDPSYVTATANLAKQIWAQSGDIERAGRLYREAITASPSPASSWIVSDFAVFCDEALSDYDQAAALYEQASQDENYPLAYARQASFLLKHKIDTEKAKELLTLALEKGPNDSNILRLAGYADFFYFQNPEAALQKLHKACSLAPSDVYALRLTADLCMMTGDSASAAYYYRRLINRQEYDAEVEGNYGLALLAEKKVEGALRHLSKARRSHPDNFGIQANLSAALWTSGKQTEGIASMRSIIDAAPPPAIEVEVLAMLYVAAPGSRQETGSRLRGLIADGARADGMAVRAMVRQKSRNEKDIGEKLARIIELKEAVPSNW